MDNYLNEILDFVLGKKCTSKIKQRSFLRKDMDIKSLLYFVQRQKLASRQDFAKIRKKLSNYDNFDSRLHQVRFKFFLRFGVLDHPLAMRILANNLMLYFNNLISPLNKLDSRLKRVQNAQITMLFTPPLGKAGIEKNEDLIKEILSKKNLASVMLNLKSLSIGLDLINFDSCVDGLALKINSLARVARTNNKVLIIKSSESLNLAKEVFKASLSGVDGFLGISVGCGYLNALDVIEELISFSKARIKQGFKPVLLRLCKSGFTQNGVKTPCFDEQKKINASFILAIKALLRDKNYLYLSIQISSMDMVFLSLAYIYAKKSDALAYFTFEQFGTQESYEFTSISNLVLFNNKEDVRGYLSSLCKQDDYDFYDPLASNDSKMWNKTRCVLLDAFEEANKLKALHEKALEGKGGENLEDIYPQIGLEGGRTWQDFIAIIKKEEFNPKAIYPFIKGVKTYTKSVIKKGFWGREYECFLCTKKEILHLNKQISSKNKTNPFVGLEIASKLVAYKKALFVRTMMADSGCGLLFAYKEVLRMKEYLAKYSRLAKHFLQKYENDKNTKINFVESILLNKPDSLPVVFAYIACSLAFGIKLVINPPKSLAFSLKLANDCFCEAGFEENLSFVLPACEEDLGMISFSQIINFDEKSVLCKESNCINIKQTPAFIYADKNYEDLISNIKQIAFCNQALPVTLMLETKLYQDAKFKQDLQDMVDSIKENDPALRYKACFCATLCKDGLQNDDCQGKGTQEKACQKSGSKNDNSKKEKHEDGYEKASNKIAIKPKLTYADDKNKDAWTLKIISVKNTNEAKNLIKKQGIQASICAFAQANEASLFGGLNARVFYKKNNLAKSFQQDSIFLEGFYSDLSGYFIPGEANFIANFCKISTNKTGDKISVGPLCIAIRQICLKQSDNEYQKELDLLFNISASYHYWAVQGYKEGKISFPCKPSFMYKRVELISYRVGENDTFLEIMSIAMAAFMLEIKLYLSYENNASMDRVIALINDLKQEVQIRRETCFNFITKIPTASCIRYLTPPNKDDYIYKNARHNKKLIIHASPQPNGRFELLNYLYVSSVE